MVEIVITDIIVIIIILILGNNDQHIISIIFIANIILSPLFYHYPNKCYLDYIHYIYNQYYCRPPLAVFNITFLSD